MVCVSPPCPSPGPPWRTLPLLLPPQDLCQGKRRKPTPLQTQHVVRGCLGAANPSRGTQTPRGGFTQGQLQGPPSRLKGSGWAACPWVYPSRAGWWDREWDPLWYPAAGEGLHSPITQGAEPLALGPGFHGVLRQVGSVQPAGVCCRDRVAPHK